MNLFPLFLMMLDVQELFPINLYFNIQILPQQILVKPVEYKSEAGADKNSCGNIERIMYPNVNSAVGDH